VINFEQTNYAESGSCKSGWGLEGSMSIYRFVLRSRSGKVEELGCLPLPDDREAVAFGKSVVQDMVQRTPPQQAVVMEVIEGDDRTVGRIDPSMWDMTAR
jgi:hypothetical protein